MRSKNSKTARKSKPAPKPPAPPKPPAIDQAQLAQVFTWIAQGQTEHAIAEAIAAQWPDAQARPLIVAALDKLQTSPTTVAQAWILEAYRELHRKLIEMGEYSAAVRAVARIEAIAKAQAKPPDADSPDAPPADEAEAQARAHLAPLFDDGDSLPIDELARLAADRIINGTK